MSHKNIILDRFNYLLYTKCLDDAINCGISEFCLSGLEYQQMYSDEVARGMFILATCPQYSIDVTINRAMGINSSNLIKIGQDQLVFHSRLSF